MTFLFFIRLTHRRWLSSVVPNSRYVTHSLISSIRECSQVTVECPEINPLKEEPLIFTATVSGVEQDKKLEYEWRVSRGEIKSGQGTPSITVEVKRDGTGVGAVVRVKGLPEGCGEEAGCHITHY